MRSSKQHTDISGGWGYGWTADPDRGKAKDQPATGSSAIEMIAIWERLTMDTNSTDRRKEENYDAFTHCRSPLRRGSTFGTRFHNGSHIRAPKPANVRCVVTTLLVRNLIVEYFSGPATITEAEDYPWGDIDGIATGISFYHSAVRMAEITDGTTSTYLLGEKYLNPDSYTDGNDNEDLYSGFNNDNHRIAYYDPVTKTALTRQDYPRSFGSAHAGSCFMSFCDGSVQAISYEIDPLTHQRMGNRMDGKSIEVR